MEIRRLSQETLARDFAGAASLADVIKMIEQDIWSQGQVVCAVRVNGMSFSEQDEQRFAETRVTELQEIEVQIEEPRVLMQSTVEAILQLLPDLEKAGLSAASSYRNQELTRAATILADLLESCRWLTDTLGVIKDGLKAWSPGAAAAKEWQQAEDGYRRLVTEILRAVEQGDFVLLADLLEYDLANVLEAWRLSFTKVLGECPQKATAVLS